MASDAQFAFDLAVAMRAAGRWQRQAPILRQKQRARENGKFDQLDTKDRLAKRANRLVEALREGLPSESYDTNEELRAVVNRPDFEADEMDNVTYERIIGMTKDFLAIRFFEDGRRASRSVCRIVTKLDGARVSYGTGFLVSPRLLLTNHHVLPSSDMAARTVAQFRYEVGEGGLPVPDEFEIDPGQFFLSDKDLDFALVAVAPSSRNSSKLSDYGYCALIAAEGKIVPGEPVNIIQHPLGEPKQVVIRENRLLDLPKPDGIDPAMDRYAQYEADTERGSSGSPVFNDQWEVVALHHSGVPRTNNTGQLVDRDGNVIDARQQPSRIVWIGNEGIRVSRLMRFIADAKLPSQWEALRQDLMQLSKEGSPVQQARTPISPRPQQHADDGSRRTTRHEKHVTGSAAMYTMEQRNGTVQVTIPLTISVLLGA
jgi:endonuclease G, mitochondrial